MEHLPEIFIRDPFVLPVGDEGLYYLYGANRVVGFDVYTSRHRNLAQAKINRR